MKWIALTALAVLTALPAVSHAQQVKTVPIGNLPAVEGNGPANWGMSGYSILTVMRSDGNRTPYMRTAVYDARLVEILSRTESPPLRPSDIRAIRRGDREDIVVRGWLLAEVKMQDAQAAKMSMPALADQWVKSCRKALPQVAPQPSPFGIG